MRQSALLLILLTSLSLGSGCAICCAPYDCDYPYVGGRWVRHNPSTGRVGSAFDEAGGPIDAVPSGATTGEPTPAQPTELPPGRSVIPRNLGDGYLPTSP